MKRKNSLFSPWHFIMLLFMTAFVVTCSFLLFLNGYDVPALHYRAKLTFVNVFLLSLFLTLIDVVARYYMVKRPIDKILKVTSELKKGNFAARIPLSGIGEFDIIAEDINALAEELAGTETLRTGFIADVSHELKTPLAVIQNYSSMLQNPDLAEEERVRYAQTLILTSHKLTGLITNILKLNKLENQQIFPNKQRFDLGEQLCECIFGFENALEEKQLNVETDIAQNVSVYSDSELLSLVWNNLISNAVKFTDEGGTVGITLKSENGAAVVSVSDTGCGISPETGKHIFEKFYQGDRSHSAVGNGLGLALVKRVAGVLGAEIGLKSRVGEGSVFTIRLRSETDEAEESDKKSV